MEYEVKPPPQTFYDRILERRLFNIKCGGGNIPLPYVDEHSSLGTTWISSSLVKWGFRDANTI